MRNIIVVIFMFQPSNLLALDMDGVIDDEKAGILGSR